MFRTCFARWLSFFPSSGLPIIPPCSCPTMRWQHRFLTAHLQRLHWTALQIWRLDPAPTNGLTNNPVTLTCIRRINERGKNKPVTVIVAQKTRKEMDAAKSSESVRERKDISIMFTWNLSTLVFIFLGKKKKTTYILLNDQFLVFFWNIYHDIWFAISFLSWMTKTYK